MTSEVLRYAAFTTGTDVPPCGSPGGNPAGVVLDAGSLTDAQMLAIAQAIGYSETAFVVFTGDAEATVRFFSPVAEVAFCGHATVATAVAYAERRGPRILRLTTATGVVEVGTRVEGGDLVATLTSPPTTTASPAAAVVDEALAALRWTREDVDARYPVHVAFAGNQHLVLGVRSRETLANLDYEYPVLDALMAREGWTTAHLFWAENAHTFHARNPFPPGGVVEDPATGAAAAAFGGYLRDLGLVPLPSRVMIHQGYDLGAPSLLQVDVEPGESSVRVTGRATRLALSPYDDLLGQGR